MPVNAKRPGSVASTFARKTTRGTRANMSFIHVSSVFIRAPLLALLFAIFAANRLIIADDFLGHSFEQWSEMLNSSQQTERAYAAWALGQIATLRAGSPNDQVYFAELVKLIHDNDPTVRYWGVLGL